MRNGGIFFLFLLLFIYRSAHKANKNKDNERVKSNVTNLRTKVRPKAEGLLIFLTKRFQFSSVCARAV